MVQGPSEQVIQTLARVQELVRSNGAARPYKSCLVQQQLVLKLVNQEPGSLGNDVVGSVQQLVADPGSAWLAARISVRRGCTLVTLDLVACCPAADLADTALGPTALTAPLPQDSETLQVWLDKLLAPGTEHKAGDTVHLQVGSCWMQATFSGSPPSWQLTALPPSPLNLAITAASQREQAYSIWLSRRSAPMAQLWSATFLAIILSCALRSAQEGVLVKEIPTHLTLALPYVLSGLLAAQGYFRAYEPSQVLHALVRAGVLVSGCLGYTVFPSSYSNGYMAHIDTWAEVLLHTPAEHV
ncbi:hypothetical protein HaLaN_27127 [Haematococcus lacustris]|uniref:Uncharacterized protein n=1 Tax=Haematococcus lacustris TaxID=44745 RepID=A0A6A0A933_HAELA|nr:hypothetical protein HaLaN_27127 [Haematococcus lacustris]